MSRDPSLDPRITPPEGFTARETRDLWPTAVEHLETLGSIGTLVVDADGLSFESDAPSSALTWRGGRWHDDDGMCYDGNTWWVA